MNANVSRWVLYATTIALYLVLGGLWISKGRYLADEGWYAYNAVSIFHGHWPYHDFLFTQTPLLLYVYGPLLQLFGESLWVGRWISLGFGLSALLLVMHILEQRQGRIAALLAAAMWVLNLGHIHVTGSIITQPLTLFWTALAFWVFQRDVRDIWRVGLCIFVLQVAVLTRLSMLPVLGICGLAFFYYSPHLRRFLLLFGLVSLGAWLGLFALFDANGNLLFGIYHFHQLYYAKQSLVQKWGLFGKPWLLCQFPILVGFGVALVLLLGRRKFADTWQHATPQDLQWTSLVLLSYALTTGLHMGVPVPNALYQHSNLVFVVLFTAFVLGRFLALLTPTPRTLWCIGYIVLCVSAMPFQHFPIEWNGVGAYKGTQQALAILRQKAPQAKRILAVQTELALEGGYRVLPGFELGQFSIWANVSNGLCKRFHLTNAARFFHYIRTQSAEIIALTERDIQLLTHAHPSHPQRMLQLLQRFYLLVGEVPYYGQFASKLFLFVRKKKPVGTNPMSRPR